MVTNAKNVECLFPTVVNHGHMKRRKTMWEIIQGDCMEILPTLTRQFDLIFADPPYLDRPIRVTTKHISHDYGRFFMDWFPLAKKCLKPKGTILMTLDQRRVIPLLATWKDLPKDIWIYDKRGSGKILYWKDSPYYISEWILDWHYSKERYIDRTILRQDIIKCRWDNQFTVRPALWHPTPKNIDLMVKLVEGLCPKDGWVLDPFCGSATTLVACKMTQRNGVGIEINEDYCQQGKKRIAKTKVILKLLEFLRTS